MPVSAPYRRLSVGLVRWTSHWQIAARDAEPRTTTIYDRRRQNFDRHAAYVVVAFVAGG